MKTHVRFLIWLLALASCEQGSFLEVSQYPVATHTPTHIIRLDPHAVGLQIRQGARPDSTEIHLLATRLFEKLRLSEHARIGSVYTHLFTGFEATLQPEEAALLLHQPAVLAIEENVAFAIAQVPAPYHNTDTVLLFQQQLPWGIARLHAPGVAAKENRAWILDTGVDLDHPDLNVNRADSRCFLPPISFEFDAEDYNGHGTHIGGVIGAMDNHFGVVGIAPGTELVAVKVLSRNGIGTLSTILAGLEYAAEKALPGDVINLSFAGRSSALMDEAVKSIASKGIYVVIAAGNNSKDIEFSSPARVEATRVFTVAAVDTTLAFAAFSNFGTGVDFAEPGTRILSTYRNGQYAVLSGTSCAAPHLSGLLLLPDTLARVPIAVAVGDPDGKPDPILGILPTGH